MSSQILINQNNISIHSVLFDHENIKSALLERQGNEEGLYYLPGQMAQRAYLPAIQDELEELNADFERASQQSVNEGKSPLAPDEWPEHLLERKLKLEATHDVLVAECEVLQEALNKYIDQEKERSDDLMLKYGPLGSGQLRDGFLIELDGQHVKPDSEGILRITDERSPTTE
jgi:hypothetical protein